MALVTIVGSGGEWSGAPGRCSSSRVMQALCHALMHFRLASVRRPYIVLRCSGNNARIQQLAGLLRHLHAQARGECACRLFVHGTCCCAGSQSSKVWLHWLHASSSKAPVLRDEEGCGARSRCLLQSVCCKLQCLLQVAGSVRKPSPPTCKRESFVTGSSLLNMSSCPGSA